MSTNYNTHIAKLNGSGDFSSWKRRIMAIIQDKDYDLSIAYDDVTFNPLPEAPDLSDTSRTGLKRTDLKTRGIIELHVEDHVLTQLIPLRSAHAYWVKLHDLYQRRTISSIVYLLRNLLTCSQNGLPAQEYVALVQSRAQDLENVGIKLCNEVISALVLCNLDSRFSHVATVLDTQDPESVTLTKICGLLLNEEARQDQDPAFCQANKVVARPRCKVHPHLSHSDAQCYSQHPELRPANWKPKSNKHQQDSQYEYACKASTTPFDQRPRCWHIDTGCSNHMTFETSTLRDFQRTDTGPVVQLGDNSVIPTVGRGKSQLKVRGQSILLENVLAVPDLGKNLFSPGQAASTGLKFLIDGDYMTIFQGTNFVAPTGNIVTRIRKGPDNLYKIQPQGHVSASFAIRHDRPLPLSLWHARLGHTSIDEVVRMSKTTEYGIKLQSLDDRDVLCVSCVMGKMTRSTFRGSETIHQCPGSLIVSDLMGPFPQAGIDGSKYFVTYTDVHSRFCTVALLKKKSEQFGHLKMFESNFTNQHGVVIKAFQTDNGGEYMSKEIQEWFRHKGIHHRRTVPGDSQSNGLAERLNRTLTDIALSVMHQARLPPQCFPWAIQVAAHLYNRRSHSALKKSPYEVLFGKTPRLEYLRTFGCTAFRHLHDHERKKTDFRAQKLVFIGYAPNQKAYLLYSPQSKKTFASRDVEFDENSFDYGFGRESKQAAASSDEDLVSLSVMRPLRTDQVESDHHSSLSTNDENSTDTSAHQDVELSNGEYVHEEPGPRDPALPVSQDLPEQLHVPSTESNDDDDQRSQQRPQRIRRQPGEWWKATANYTQIPENSAKDMPRPDISSLRMATTRVPQSVADVVISSEAGHWHDAMNKEFQQMLDFSTWTLQELPADRKAIASKWVFDLKPSLSGDGSVRKFKARLVIKGFSQRAGIDYNETFAPVAHTESLRVVMALAAQNGLFLRQVDIVGAFLNGTIEEDIYMKQPDHFIQKGKEQLVCKLNKALYGLKQAGMVWNTQLDSFLVDQLHFRRTIADPCLYHLRHERFIAILLIHVDDILIAHNDMNTCNGIIDRLKAKWDVTDLGEPSRLLGMQLQRDGQTGSIFLHQQDYIDELLQRFNMVNCKHSATPHQPGHYLSKNMSPSNEQEHQDMKLVPYSELVGSLNWLATRTRPDIANSVGSLCRFISNPGRQHWTAAQRVLRYLAGSSEQGIKFARSSQDKQAGLVAFSDADWAGDPDTRRSTTGFFCTLFECPISWKSKLQPSTALSSVEAEYIALCAACREVKWIRQLLSETEFPERQPTVIYDDNRGCISISENNRTDARTKHIDVKYHFVRQMMQGNQVTIQYLPTHEMTADIFTKPTATSVFKKFCAQLIASREHGFRGRIGSETQFPTVTDQPDVTSSQSA